MKRKDKSARNPHKEADVRAILRRVAKLEKYTTLYGSKEDTNGMIRRAINTERRELVEMIVALASALGKAGMPGILPVEYPGAVGLVEARRIAKQLEVHGDLWSDDTTLIAAGIDWCAQHERRWWLDAFPGGPYRLTVYGADGEMPLGDEIEAMIAERAEAE